jgi:uncharacterized membrane protein
VCGRAFAAEDVTQGLAVRSVVADLIRRDHPNWSAASRICRDDLARYSIEYLESLLQLEQGELTTLGKDAIQSLQRHGLLSANVEAAFEKDWTIGQRLTDRLTRLGASRGFVLSAVGLLGASILTSAAALYFRPSDPFPFLLVTLVACGAVAVQAPIIALSQLPHGVKDRLRWEHSYLMSLKGEQEIRQLSRSVESLSAHQRERLVEIQQTLLLLMSRPARIEPPQRTVRTA